MELSYDNSLFKPTSNKEKQNGKENLFRLRMPLVSGNYAVRLNVHLVPNNIYSSSGVVYVKFKQGQLTKLTEQISASDIVSTDTKKLLQGHGLNSMRKLFRSWNPGDTLVRAKDGNLVRLIDLSRWYTIKVDETTNIDTLISQLMKLPDIEAAAPAHLFVPFGVFPNDPRFTQGYQWGLYNYGSPGKDVHAPDAWTINKGRSDVIVAVLDGGIDYHHHDLDPGDRSRVIQGYDFGDGDSDPMDDIPDGQGYAGHGTSVAGVIGAITNNGLNVSGVMWNCKLMPVKIATTNGVGPFHWSIGTAYDGDIVDGINYARSNGASIINMSFGGNGQGFWEDVYKTLNSNPMAQATWNAYQAGVVLVGAMGNDDNNTANYPASYPWVIAVGASNENDARVTGVGWGSNYGPQISVIAPGIDYYSTVRNQSDGWFGGTSCATPVVSGIAGLIISQSRDHGLNLTNDDVRHLIEASADKVSEMQGQNWTQYDGYGRVNAYNALILLSSPYTFTQAQIVGGTTTLTWDSHNHVFYNNAGLASGAYYGVKQYKVSSHITFPKVYSSIPKVWIRERQTKGWSYANPGLELPWAQISNVTTTGFDVQTVVYWIGSNSIGQQINKYYPCDPSQATVAYTAIGVPAPYSASISGPLHLNAGQMGTYTATATNGAPPYSYLWEKMENSGGAGPVSALTISPNRPPINTWVVIGTNSPTVSTGDVANSSFQIRCTLTDAARNVVISNILYVTVGGSANVAAKNPGTDAAIAPLIPESNLLGQNYPNPFNPSTEIRFGLSQPLHVRLIVYDLLGREVAKLADEDMDAGYHSVTWNANNVSSGVYIYRLSAGDFVQVRRMVVMK
jgi:hypothetical protein